MEFIENGALTLKGLKALEKLVVNFYQKRGESCLVSDELFTEMQNLNKSSDKHYNKFGNEYMYDNGYEPENKVGKAGKKHPLTNIFK